MAPKSQEEMKDQLKKVEQVKEFWKVSQLITINEIFIEI